MGLGEIDDVVNRELSGCRVHDNLPCVGRGQTLIQLRAAATTARLHRSRQLSRAAHLEALLSPAIPGFRGRISLVFPHNSCLTTLLLQLCLQGSAITLCSRPRKFDSYFFRHALANFGGQAIVYMAST